MGNSRSELPSLPPKRFNALKLINELNIKQKETIILLVGAPESGKTTIINNIIQMYGSTAKYQFIKSKYHIGSFSFIELTDPLISNHASYKLNFLDFMYRYPWTYKQFSSGLQSVCKIHELGLFETEQRDRHYPHDDRTLILGYIHEIEQTFNNSKSFTYVLIDLILSYYDMAQSMVKSYKLLINDKIYDFWDINGNDFMQATCTELLKYIDTLIFVIDITSYDVKVCKMYHSECNAECNKLIREIILWRGMMQFIDFYVGFKYIQTPVVLMNKMDKFKDKIKDVPLRQFAWFKDVYYKMDALVSHDDNYNASLNIIKETVNTGICNTNRYHARYCVEHDFYDVCGVDIDQFRKVFDNLFLKRYGVD